MKFFRRIAGVEECGGLEVIDEWQSIFGVEVVVTHLSSVAVFV